jgi:hypothetical protein
VYRDSPVAVLNVKKAAPWGLSESKSMISRCKSSGVAAFVDATAVAKVVVGGGVAIGSKPRFRFTQARVAVVIGFPFCGSSSAS